VRCGLAEAVELGVVVVRLDTKVAGEAGAKAWPGGGALAVSCHGRAGVVEEVGAAASGRRGGRRGRSGAVELPRRRGCDAELGDDGVARWRQLPTAWSAGSADSM
jgi:hypothetical protein